MRDRGRGLKCKRQKQKKKGNINQFEKQSRWKKNYICMKKIQFCLCSCLCFCCCWCWCWCWWWWCWCWWWEKEEDLWQMFKVVGIYVRYTCQETYKRRLCFVTAVLCASSPSHWMVCALYFKLFKASIGVFYCSNQCCFCCCYYFILYFIFHYSLKLIAIV